MFQQLFIWVHENHEMLFGAVARPDWTVSIWADCGERIKNVLYMSRLLQDELRTSVRLNFFCPRHGHSECDSHFAHGKMVLFSHHHVTFSRD